MAEDFAAGCQPPPVTGRRNRIGSGRFLGANPGPFGLSFGAFYGSVANSPGVFRLAIDHERIGIATSGSPERLRLRGHKITPQTTPARIVWRRRVAGRPVARRGFDEFQPSVARSSSNPGRISERIFPSVAAQESN